MRMENVPRDVRFTCHICGKPITRHDEQHWNFVVASGRMVHLKCQICDARKRFLFLYGVIARRLAREGVPVNPRMIANVMKDRGVLDSVG